MDLGMDPPPPQCSLLVGAAAAVAQVVLALLAFAALAYKRQVEWPQRPIGIWALDGERAGRVGPARSECVLNGTDFHLGAASKQAISMVAAHICGEAPPRGMQLPAGTSTTRCPAQPVAPACRTWQPSGLPSPLRRHGDRCDCPP